ncbi:serine hydrolase FSH [Dendryphion nanum]|uniref:Serine hydrolase FSH n=1 Tax=Dendryphion nanum TaxID=256645 RepID=A0A9P9E3P3_9PLEO|nr:serine hydrolase FSH [Dendryphion nanum]
MRFLCLHGRGTNAEIFKFQTANIRAALSEDHEFVFVNGNIPARPLAEIALGSEFGKERRGFWPAEMRDGEEFRRVYHDMRAFIQKQGPFFGFLVFSEGASIASTILIEDIKRHGGSLGIQCAIFFCAAPPLDLDWERVGEIRLMKPGLGDTIVDIPTAHIWSEGNHWLPGLGKDLVGMCDKRMSEEVVHNLGHDVPRSREDECWRETIRAIERTIEKGKMNS